MGLVSSQESTLRLEEDGCGICLTGPIGGRVGTQAAIWPLPKSKPLATLTLPLF